MGQDAASVEVLRAPSAAEPDPYTVLNAGCWSVWCRACPWRTRSTPTGPDLANFRVVRAAAEQTWRDHLKDAHEAEGAPTGRLEEVGSAPPATLPEVA